MRPRIGIVIFVLLWCPPTSASADLAYDRGEVGGSPDVRGDDQNDVIGASSGSSTSWTSTTPPGESSGNSGNQGEPIATTSTNESADGGQPTIPLCFNMLFIKEPCQSDPVEPPPETPPEVTGGDVVSAFASIPLPESPLNVEPSDGRTLVNFATNFYTVAEPFDRTVVLLGQRVDLHIVPARFLWNFGDGEQSATERPGSPYPRLDITHEYATADSFSVSVDTVYTATWRLNGGPWQPVDGTVTKDGTPQPLTAVTATPRLVR